MGATYSAQVEKHSAVAKRETSVSEREVEISINDIIVREDGDEVLRFDRNHISNLEALAEDLRDD